MSTRKTLQVVSKQLQKVVVKIACTEHKPVIDNSAVVSYIREKMESLKSVKVIN